jgi:hypothetical protein
LKALQALLGEQEWGEFFPWMVFELLDKLDNPTASSFACSSFGKSSVG